MSIDVSHMMTVKHELIIVLDSNLLLVTTVVVACVALSC